jgi:hypothetical protein
LRINFLPTGDIYPNLVTLSVSQITKKCLSYCVKNRKIRAASTDVTCSSKTLNPVPSSLANRECLIRYPETVELFRSHPRNQVHTYVYTYVCTYICIYLHMYIPTYVYICMYICRGEDLLFEDSANAANINKHQLTGHQPNFKLIKF